MERNTVFLDNKITYNSQYMKTTGLLPNKWRKRERVSVYQNVIQWQKIGQRVKTSGVLIYGVVIIVNSTLLYT